jgi:riboflavin synthase
MPANGDSGHFVSGHIDGMGKSPDGKDRADHVIDFRILGIMRYVVFKGSIAVDGTVSLPKSLSGGSRFGLPPTYEVTALRQRTRGDFVNLETDLIGKYVEKLVNPISAG